MRKYQYPCDGCTKRICDYRHCGAYCRWISAVWKEFGRYENRPYWECSADADDKLLYVHPEVFRKYLQSGPCGRCSLEKLCETPCRSYWQWWDARMVWLKKKFQNGAKIPSRLGGDFYDTNSARRAMKSLFLGHSEVSEKYSFQTSSSRLA